MDLRQEIFAEHAPVPVWAWDARGLRFVNPAFERFVGRAEVDLRSGDGSELVHPEDRGGFQARLALALLDGQPLRHRMRVRRADGEYRCVEVIAERAEEAGWVGYVACGFDVTEARDAEQALRSGDRRKNEFLAMLAHELRNPLGAIRNAACLLRDGADAALLARAADMIDRQVRHMRRMVEELLDVTRITHGKIDLRAEAVDLCAVARRAAEATEAGRTGRDQPFALRLPEAALWINGDAMRVEQVVANLLDNASKFSARGAAIDCALERDGRGFAVLRVRDHGIGMAPATLARLFELYMQGAAADDDHGVRTGIGLGLALSRRLVALHGGTIEAASDGPGQGSEFVLRLPTIACPEPGAEAPAVKTVGPARRVLVVDGHADRAESLELLLQMAGHDVRVVHEGREAMREAARFRPDLLVLDLGLGDMDARAAARALRESGLIDGARILALASRGGDIEQALSRRAGIDLHLVKPVDPGALLEAVRG